MDEFLHFLKLIICGWTDGAIPQPGLMSGIRPPNGSDVLTVRLKDMFASLRTAHDKTVVIGLDKHIPLPGSLHIVDNFSNWPPLS